MVSFEYLQEYTWQLIWLKETKQLALAKGLVATCLTTLKYKVIWLPDVYKCILFYITSPFFSFGSNLKKNKGTIKG